jgi:polyphosphate kinase
MKHLLSSLDYPNRNHPLIVGSSAHVIGRDEHIVGNSLDMEKKRRRR